MAPIVQYWDTGELPAEIAPLMATFDLESPRLTRVVFDRESAAELIATRFGGAHAKAFDSCAVPAMQADYLRYCAIHALGGIYADVDFRCVGALSELLAEPGTGTLYGRAELPARWRKPELEWRERAGDYRVVMNSFFAFPRPGHPLLALAIEIASANISARVAEDVALVTGPAIFTSLYQLHVLGSFSAFVEYLQGSALEHAAQMHCETIGEYARVERAFAGVRVLPEPESRRWVTDSDRPLPYKQSATHWPNVTSSIYR